MSFSAAARSAAGDSHGYCVPPDARPETQAPGRPLRAAWPVSLSAGASRFMLTPHPMPIALRGNSKGFSNPGRGASRSCWRIFCTADFPVCCLAGFPTRRPSAQLPPAQPCQQHRDARPGPPHHPATRRPSPKIARPDRSSPASIRLFAVNPPLFFAYFVIRV